MLETYLDKNWYCLEFDLTGSDLGFTTKFLISMTELFVRMNSFMITERNENQWIYQWVCDIHIIWKLSNVILLRIIVFKLFKYWNMLIVFLFLVLIISRFCSQIFKEHDPNLHLCGKGPVKSVLFICPSVYLCVCDALSWRYSMWIFKIFCMRIFCHIYLKVTKR